MSFFWANDQNIFWWWPNALEQSTIFVLSSFKETLCKSVVIKDLHTCQLFVYVDSCVKGPFWKKKLRVFLSLLDHDNYLMTCLFKNFKSVVSLKHFWDVFVALFKNRRHIHEVVLEIRNVACVLKKSPAFEGWAFRKPRVGTKCKS